MLAASSDLIDSKAFVYQGKKQNPPQPVTHDSRSRSVFTVDGSVRTCSCCTSFFQTALGGGGRLCNLEITGPRSSGGVCVPSPNSLTACCHKLTVLLPMCTDATQPAGNSAVATRCEWMALWVDGQQSRCTAEHPCTNTQPCGAQPATTPLGAQRDGQGVCFPLRLAFQTRSGSNGAGAQLELT